MTLPPIRFGYILPLRITDERHPEQVSPRVSGDSNPAYWLRQDQLLAIRQTFDELPIPLGYQQGSYHPPHAEARREDLRDHALDFQPRKAVLFPNTFHAFGHARLVPEYGDGDYVLITGNGAETIRRYLADPPTNAPRGDYEKVVRGVVDQQRKESLLHTAKRLIIRTGGFGETAQQLPDRSLTNTEIKAIEAEPYPTQPAQAPFKLTA